MLGANAKKSANVNEYFDYQKERKLPQTSNLRDFPEYEADDIKLSNNLSPDMMGLKPECYKNPLEV